MDVKLETGWFNVSCGPADLDELYWAFAHVATTTEVALAPLGAAASSQRDA
jgi:hypothetical protein